MTSRAFTVSLALAAACLLGDNANAQTQAGGLTFGLSAGASRMSYTFDSFGPGQAGRSFDEAPYGLGTELHAGYMFSPSLAVLLSASGNETLDSDTSQIVHSLGLKFWPTSRLYLRGGLGTGRHVRQVTGGQEDGDWTFGFLVGAGYEFARPGKFALDVQVRYTRANQGAGSAAAHPISSVAVLLGSDFYLRRREP